MLGTRKRWRNLPMGGAPGASAAAYLGLVCNSCITANTLNGGVNQLMVRKRHVATRAITALQVSYSNWYINASFVETGSGGTSTYTAGIEYNGVTSQVLWSALASTTAVSGADTALSDALAISIPAGAEFFERIYVTNATAMVYYGQSVSGFSVASVDTANGESTRFAVSGLSDQTTATGATTGGTSANSLIYSANRIVMSITAPSVMLLHDSRGVGANAAFVGTTGNRGEVERSIGSIFGIYKSGVSGDSALKFVASHAKRVALGTGGNFTHVINSYGVNDILNNAQSPVQLAALQTTIAGYFPGLQYFLTTLAPRTTSSDLFATTSGQTVNAHTQDILDYNALVRAGISGVKGYFDVADALDPTRSGLWPVNGTNNYYTGDGLHESSNGDLLIQSNNAINPQQIVR